MHNVLLGLHYAEMRKYKSRFLHQLILTKEIRSP